MITVKHKNLSTLRGFLLNRKRSCRKNPAHWENLGRKKTVKERKKGETGKEK
jgi:hypothetical protein